MRLAKAKCRIYNHHVTIRIGTQGPLQRKLLVLGGFVMPHRGQKCNLYIANFVVATI